MGTAGLRIDRALNTDFCPWANRYVYWMKSPLGLLSLAALASLAAAVLVAPQGWVVFAALLTVIAVGIAWPWIGLMGLECCVVFDRRRVTEGDHVPVRIAIRNRWPFPVWGLAVEKGFLGAGDARSDRTAVALACVTGWCVSEFYWDFVPNQRGIYPQDQPVLSTEFPFGLWKAVRRIGVQQSLVAWPRTCPLASFPVESGPQWTIATACNLRTGDEGDICGTRPFRRGDSLRSIHWAQSARYDRLIACERQAATQSEVTIVIDTAGNIHSGHAAGSSLEWCLRVGASLCRCFHQHHTTVRCYFGNYAFVIPPGSGDLSKIFDALAALPVNGEPIPGACPGTGPSRAMSPGSLAIVVTTDQGLSAWNAGRTARRHKFIVVRTAVEERLECQGGAGVPAGAAAIVLDLHSQLPLQLQNQWRSLCHATWCGAQ